MHRNFGFDDEKLVIKSIVCVDAVGIFRSFAVIFVEKTNSISAEKNGGGSLCISLKLKLVYTLYGRGGSI